MAIILRPYQEQGLADIRAAFRYALSLVYVLSTGGGKTPMLTAIAQGAAAKGKRILILVHRNELLTQARDKLTELGVPSGVIKAGRPMELTWHVQVGSIQTVVRRLDILPEPDLIICDEGHHAASTSYVTVFQHWAKARRLLVSATPERLDGKGLAAVADRMILGPDMRTLIAGGYLARPVVYAAPDAPDTSALHTVAGDYDMHEAEELMDRPKITGDAVDHYRRLCDHKPALAFCTSLRHAEHVAEQFRQARYQASIIEGRHTDHERSSMLRDLATGALHVLTSVSLIGEGVDVPRVEASILLRPTKSVSVYLQQVGRCMRIYPGKERALVLDHVNAHAEHGLPTAERIWSLAGRPKKKKDAPIVAVKQCPQCFATHEPTPICPECGFIYPVKQRSGPDQVDGELVEIKDPADLFNEYKTERDPHAEVHAAQTLEELKAIAKRRKYHHKWALHVWNGRQDKFAKQQENAGAST